MSRVFIQEIVTSYLIRIMQDQVVENSWES